MPKIKLRGQQFIMIANSLRKTKKNEEFEFYLTLCNSTGKEVNISNPEQLTYFELVDTKTQAIEKFTKTEKLLTARIKLFEAERKDSLLTDEEAELLNLMKASLQEVKDFLAKFYEKCRYLDELQNIAIIFESKANDTDIIKIYDDDSTESDDSSREEDPCYPFIGNWGD